MRAPVIALVLASVLLGLAAPARSEDARQAIAVLDLRAQGAAEYLTRSLTPVILKEVDRLGLFRSVGMDDIARMLEHTENRIRLGCDDTACLAEVGGALGVELLLSGNLGRVGEAWLLSLQLIDVRQAAVLQRAEETVRGSPEELVERARSATRQVLQPLFDQAKGFLEVRCSEEGAEVYAGDRLLGTTPLPPVELAGGIHKVRVEKKRFVAFAGEVTIRRAQLSPLEVKLVPSAEFAAEVESSARRDRALAWTFTGLGAALAATAVGLYVWNDGRLDGLEADQAAYLAGTYAGTVQALNARAEEINLTDSLTWIPVGGAVVSVGLSLYFWIAGDEPGRYAEEATPPPSLRPAPGGMAVDF